MSAEDRIALQDVMLRYAAGVDDQDMEQYASCFHPDVEVHGMGPHGVVYGRDAWVAYVTEALDRYDATQHLLGPQLATIDGDTAKARTDVQALHCLAGQEDKTLTLWGTYLTELARIDGEWKITRHELVKRSSKLT